MGSAGGTRTTCILPLMVLLATACFPAGRGASEASSGGRGRSLLGFRETLGNTSFQCSPSGPCIPCQYSEKNDEKYRCSETGYRLPLKCIEAQDDPKEKPKNKSRRKLFHLGSIVSISNSKFRKLMDDSSASDSGKQSYVTYRSCIPAEGEEKLSILGFELLMVCLLLVSGPVVYLRQKRPNMMLVTGATRIPTNSPRF